MIKTLIIDFNNYNGHHMVITRKNPFKRDELHELESNMLRDNVIRSLLPLTWLEVNDELSFQYKIEGYRLLSHYLRKQQLTMLRYYSLLLSLTDALASCYEFMLRPDCCVIDENYLYIDEQQEKILLAYLPLQGSVTEQQAQQLLILAVRWADIVIDLDTAGYHRILNLLSTEELAINPLRQLLLELIHRLSQNNENSEQFETHSHPSVLNHPSLAVVQHKSSSKTAHKYNSNSALTQFHDTVTGTPSNSQPVLTENTKNHISSNEKADLDKVNLDKANRLIGEVAVTSSEFSQWQGLEMEDLYDGDMDEAKFTWKHGMITIVMLALLSLAWQQLYLGSPSSENLLLCSGISIGIIALLAFTLLKPIKRWIARLRQDKDLQLTADWDSPMMMEDSLTLENDDDRKVNRKLSSLLGSLQAKPQQFETDSRGASKGVDINKGVTVEQTGVQRQAFQLNNIHLGKEQSNHGKVVELATVPLDEAQATSMLQKDELVLLRSMNGEKEQIRIVGPSFLVGRAEEGVHYREVAKGVSRIHIEFELKNGKLHVKDAGSRNGTFLNGQLMIAYKSYPLQMGDKLQLASKDGPIYELVS